MKKTNVVFYPYSNTVVNYINHEITINRQPVQYVNSYLYLGIDIDEHLTFYEYFSTLLQIVSHKLYIILRKVRPCINKLNKKKGRSSRYTKVYIFFLIRCLFL